MCGRKVQAYRDVWPKGIVLCLQEVEILLQENDGIQRKLHSQEEEFRLQNQTLMQELQNVTTLLNTDTIPQCLSH